MTMMAEKKTTIRHQLEEQEEQKLRIKLGK